MCILGEMYILGELSWRMYWQELDGSEHTMSYRREAWRRHGPSVSVIRIAEVSGERLEPERRSDYNITSRIMDTKL